MYERLNERLERATTDAGDRIHECRYDIFEACLLSIARVTLPLLTLFEEHPSAFLKTRDQCRTTASFAELEASTAYDAVKQHRRQAQ